MQRNDEFYTTREEVEEIFEQVIGYEFLKDKIIYCPCDSEESEFVKYLKEKKDEIKYKDFWHTSDDFNTHTDLIQKADLVITNPPFSKIRREYFSLMLKYAKYYFFFFGSAGINFFDKYDVNIYPAKCSMFNTLFYHKAIKDYKAHIPHIYVTNFDCNTLCHPSPLTKTYNEIYKDKEPIYGILEDGRRYLTVDRLVNIPIDYTEPIFVPITILYNYYKRNYNIIPYSSKLQYNDGRNRYVRILVQKKNI